MLVLDVWGLLRAGRGESQSALRKETFRQEPHNRSMRAVN
jgi:hypothetical protein